MRRFFFLVQALLMACAGFAWLAGCPATTLLGIAPITAISVPISTLLMDSSLGCGEGAEDVFKYAVVVSYANTPGDPSFKNCPLQPIAGAVFDCFAAATFGNLPEQDAGFALTDSGGALPDGGSVTISVWVAFYNHETFERLGKTAIDNAANPLSSMPGTICDLGATWTTTCTATEQDNIEANAACGVVVQGKFPPPPLREASAPDAGAADAAADSADETGGDGPESDAGAEGGHDGGVDAPTDAPPG